MESNDSLQSDNTEAVIFLVVEAHKSLIGIRKLEIATRCLILALSDAA
jgi:hypothetical protein